MSEDKKDKKEDKDIKAEDKNIKSAKEEIGKNEEKDSQLEEAMDDASELDLDKDIPKETKKTQEDDDLPEEIKKKLEKKKLEKTGKKQTKRKKKKREVKVVKSGNAYIKATYNNTIITLTDQQGNVISWASAGIAGFKGPKKATPYASQIITKIACMKAKEEYGLEEVDVYVRGVGTGRESAVRALNANGIIINSIKDITPIPHNGCRRKKPRRV